MAAAVGTTIGVLIPIPGLNLVAGAVLGMAGAYLDQAVIFPALFPQPKQAPTVGDISISAAQDGAPAPMVFGQYVRVPCTVMLSSFPYPMVEPGVRLGKRAEGAATVTWIADLVYGCAFNQIADIFQVYCDNTPVWTSVASQGFITKFWTRDPWVEPTDTTYSVRFRFNHHRNNVPPPPTYEMDRGVVDTNWPNVPPFWIWYPRRNRSVTWHFVIETIPYGPAGQRPPSFPNFFHFAVGDDVKVEIGPSETGPWSDMNAGMTGRPPSPPESLWCRCVEIRVFDSQGHTRMRLDLVQTRDGNIGWARELQVRTTDTVNPFTWPIVPPTWWPFGPNQNQQGWMRVTGRRQPPEALYILPSAFDYNAGARFEARFGTVTQTPTSVSDQYRPLDPNGIRGRGVERYPGIAHFDLRRLNLSGFGNRLPQVHAIVRGVTAVGRSPGDLVASSTDLRDTIQSIVGGTDATFGGRALVQSFEFTRVPLTPDFWGYVLWGPTPISEALAPLMAAFDLHMREGHDYTKAAGKEAEFVTLADAWTVEFSSSALNANTGQFGKPTQVGVQFAQGRKLDQIRRIEVKFQEIDGDPRSLQEGTVAWTDDSVVEGQEQMLDLSNITLTRDYVERRAADVLSMAVRQSRPISVRLGHEGWGLQEGDLMVLRNVTVRGSSGTRTETISAYVVAVTITPDWMVDVDAVVVVTENEGAA